MARLSSKYDLSLVSMLVNVELLKLALASSVCALGLDGFAQTSPSILVHPTNQTALIGDNITFSVLATNDPPLFFQWQFNQAEIVGATNSSCSLFNVTTNEAGIYAVTITNSFGNITSSNAILTVNEQAPIILTNPVNQAAMEGRTVIFSGSASGGPKPVFQWHFNGTNIAGATNSSITLVNVTTNNAGGYDFIASNHLGIAQSTVAVLTVTSAPINPGALDLSFYPGTGAGSTVYASALQPDGKILIGGSFSSVNGVTRRGLARILPDGTVDSSFDAQLNTYALVNNITVQADGKILIGGSFSTVNSVNWKSFARLHTDASLDTTFGNSLGADGSVNSIVISSTGEYFLGGNFTTIYETPRNRIAKLNTNGSLDMAFVAQAALPEIVRTLAFQDGKILVGVDSLFGNSPALLRLLSDGRLDLNFDPDLSRVLTMVNTIVVQPNGKILVGGDGPTLSSTHLTRLNPDGTADSQFYAGRGANDVVEAIQLQADGKIIVAGSLNLYNSVVRRKIVRLYQDGSLDRSFDPLVGPNMGIQSVTMQPDGKILIGGAFQTVNGIPRDYIARLLGGENPTLPTILTNPISQTVTAQTNVLFSVMASGGALNFQWQHNETDMPGETNAHVILPNVELSQAGTYRVIVTNTVGSITSSIANLTVMAVTPGSRDPAFSTNSIFYTGSLDFPFINAMAIQPPYGRMIIGGQFKAAFDLTKNIARLSSNGTLLRTSVAGVSGPPPSQFGSDPVMVNAVCVQPDGCILIGGYFTSVNGVTRSNIARLLPDLTLDTNFNAGSIYSMVNAVAPQEDGKILAGGYSGIIRLTSDGGLDTNFNCSFSSSDVRAILVQPDGKIVIAGSFTAVNGVRRNNIARLNANGSTDATFDPGFGASQTVNALALRPDEKIILGGDFIHFDGIKKGRIARINANGTLDHTFHSGTGADKAITALALHNDGKVVVVGKFATIDDLSRPGVARLYSNGAVDPGLNLGSGATGVNSVVVEANGRITIGGSFTSVNGTAAKCIARVYGGDPPSSGPSIIQPPATQTVHAGTTVSLNVEASGYPLNFQWRKDGANIAGAVFQSLLLPHATQSSAGTYSVVVSNALSAIESQSAVLTVLPQPATAGTNDFSFLSVLGTSNSVSDIALQPDGKIVIAGSLTNIDGLYRRYARLQTNGQMDFGFYKQEVWTDGSVLSVALQNDGKVLIGGDFRNIGSYIPRPGLARLNPDGTLDSTFAPSLGTSELINEIIVQPDGKILVNRTTNGLARFNEDGSRDFAFSGNVPGVVMDIVLQADQKILVGGTFTNIGPVPQNRLARLNPDGSLDSSFNIGTGPNNMVTAVGMYYENKILVGGRFTDFNGRTSLRIVRLNNDGSIDTNFKSVPGASAQVNAFAVQDDGRILAAGTFTTMQGVPRNYVARLHFDGTLDYGFNGNGGPNGGLTTLVIQPDRSILIGGSFTQISGVPQTGIARLMSGAYELHLSVNNRISNSVFSGGFFAASNVVYGIQISTNLSDWEVLTNLTGADSITNFSDMEVRDESRFYRAVHLP